MNGLRPHKCLLWLASVGLVVVGIASAVLAYQGLTYVANDDALSRYFVIAAGSVFVAVIFVSAVCSVHDRLRRFWEKTDG